MLVNLAEFASFGLGIGSVCCLLLSKFSSYIQSSSNLSVYTFLSFLFLHFSLCVHCFFDIKLIPPNRLRLNLFENEMSKCNLSKLFCGGLK